MGMFEKHKLLFIFLITLKLELDKQTIDYDQIEFFLKGNISLDKYLIIKPNFLSLTDEAWHHCNLLTTKFHKKFNHLLIDIRENLT
ncbi:unnamed protein product, partial [Didymodactylos carnosus]